jgi:hypothetical protein
VPILRNEAQIEQIACSRILNKFGITSVKLTPTQSTGYPDRIFWLPGGKPLMIEFKRPGEKLRAKQEHVIGQLRTLGYDVKICVSPKQAVDTVEVELLALKWLI